MFNSSKKPGKNNRSEGDNSTEQFCYPQITIDSALNDTLIL